MTNTISRPLRLTGAACLGGLALALAAPIAASAHVSVDPGDTTPGAYTVLTFSLSHGCDGSATTSVAIDVPEAVGHASPTVNDGWTITTAETDTGSTITYTALEPLADGLRDTFELALRLPEDGAAGDAIAFPVVQSCVSGQTAWVEPVVEGEPEPELPAPTVVLTAADAASTAGAGGHAASEATSAEVQAAAPGATDETARWLGVGGIVVALFAAATGAVAVLRGAKR